MAERQAPKQPASISAHAASDVVAREDLLGFEPYVSAMARFLEETEPPLTVSIEGKWGSGKSTFMDLLAARLKPGTLREGAVVVRFNPWRHEEQEALWAAFAKEFVTSVKRQTGRPRRIAADLGLRAYQHRAALYTGLALGAFAPALGVAAYALAPRWPLLADAFAQAGLGEFAASAASGTLTLSASVVLSLKALRDPVERAITRGEKDAVAGSALMDRLREEMDRILDLYAPGRRVYVLVDDLDRSTRAADMMRALARLMADQKRVVFLLAMDREKVAASLANHQADVLPYLEPGRDAASVGLEYGHQYVEKFIQLPFRVPQPDVRDVERYFESLATPPETRPPRLRSPWYRVRAHITDGLFFEAPTRVPVKAEPSAEADRPSPFVVGKDSDEVRDVFTAIAPILDNNPRRLKQFLNLFRFRIYVAAETGLFEARDGRPAVTLQQLGKFVALSIQWPTLVDRLDDDRELLSRLEKRVNAEGVIPIREEDNPWLDRRLEDLLRLGGKDPAWKLADVPLAAFLATSPRVRILGAATLGLSATPDSLTIHLAPGESGDAFFHVTNASRVPHWVMALPAGVAPKGWMDDLTIKREPMLVPADATVLLRVPVSIPEHAEEGQEGQVQVSFVSMEARTSFQRATIVLRAQAKSQASAKARQSAA